MKRSTLSLATLALISLAPALRAAIVVDFTEQAGPTPGLVVTVSGTINTAAFASYTTLGINGAFMGLEGQLFFSGTLAQPGQVAQPIDRYVPQSSTINWFPGTSVAIQTGVLQGFGNFQLERNLSTGQMNLTVGTGLSGILAYTGPSSVFLANQTLAGIGVTAQEAAAGPYISTATSNGITDQLVFTFNGVPEPGATTLLGLSGLLVAARRRRG
ncbi:PEP-CTERM sorting domain-containing protein [Luteolibacter marinus]|uniref:PEP-CTERM sorting domain-containing protein n=1 Tax=Luteolibacter marinus TaxID=2776705 RepID=UPI0018691225|nr:PEP-CTERM sorting domain-containing protein [Luteolibacter marinus]